MHHARHALTVPARLMLFLLAALPLAWTARPARAQDTAAAAGCPACPDTGASRVVGGHAVIPAVVSEFAPMATYMGSITALGTLTQDSGDPTFGDLSAASVTESLFYGYAFTDWISLRLGGTGAVTVGTETESALVLGTIFSADVQGGPAVRLFEADTIYLSALLTAGYTVGKVVSPLGALAQTAESGRISTDTLLLDVGIWTVTPAVAGVWAPVPEFAVQGSLGLDFGETDIELVGTSFETSLNAGVAATFDAAPMAVPVAVLLGYGVDAGLSGDDKETTHAVEAGVFYSGLKYLNVGVSGLGEFGEASTSFAGTARIFHLW